MVPTAYLDTCIVSGLAKNDLDKRNTEALLNILEARKIGKINLVTSNIIHEELKRIKESYRQPHLVIYNLLADVPTSPAYGLDQNLLLMVGLPFPREDPLLTKLKSLLPDDGDAMHVFQAAKSKIAFLITVDRKSILKYSNDVKQLCGVQLMTPIKFYETVLSGN